MGHIDVTNRASQSETQALINGGHSLGSQPDLIFDEIFARIGRVPGSATFPGIGTFAVAQDPQKAIICAFESAPR